MDIDTHYIPVISTAHLTKEVADLLSEKRDANPWCPCAEWEYGFFLYLEEPEAREADDEPSMQCLLDIRDWLRKHNFRHCWVRLDADASKAPELPTYDW